VIDVGGPAAAGYAGDMKWCAALLLLAPAAGCSNAPVAGFLDTVFPSKARSGVFQDRPPAGGVWTGPAVPAAGPPVIGPDPTPAPEARFGPPVAVTSPSGSETPSASP
jgi:hypothetical protein